MVVFKQTHPLTSIVCYRIIILGREIPVNNLFIFGIFRKMQLPANLLGAISPSLFLYIQFIYAYIRSFILYAIHCIVVYFYLLLGVLCIFAYNNSQHYYKLGCNSN